MNKFISLKEKDETKMYSILSKISSGNNKNDLYRVKNKKTGKIYAAKIIKHNLDIYHKQIKLLKKFENPYIVQYYNSYEFKNKIWIITELCDCGSVQDIMKITNKCFKFNFLIDVHNQNLLPLKNIVILSYVCREKSSIMVQ